jgi:hypothetical protein
LAGSQTFGRDLSSTGRDAYPEGDALMAHAVLAPAPTYAPTPIPLRELLPWLIFAGVLLLALYFVGVEEGATAIVPGMYVHDFMHDGRHLLGFPCH